MAPKKAKGGKQKEPPKPLKGLKGKEPPKKIPPPPACFTKDELMELKAFFKAHDEEGTEKIPITLIPFMLRKFGFNPKGSEIAEFFQIFLEDEFVDVVELHEWYKMVEAKINLPDDVEAVVIKAIKFLTADEENTKVCQLAILKDALFNWGEPLNETEFVDFERLAKKEKTYDEITGEFLYEKFVDALNKKDGPDRYFKEPINFFKLDQKELAAMMIAKFEAGARNPTGSGGANK